MAPSDPAHYIVTLKGYYCRLPMAISIFPQYPEFIKPASLIGFYFPLSQMRSPILGIVVVGIPNISVNRVVISTVFDSA
jgi:hypothetical protein